MTTAFGSARWTASWIASNHGPSIGAEIGSECEVNSYSTVSPMSPGRVASSWSANPGGHRTSTSAVATPGMTFTLYPASSMGGVAEELETSLDAGLGVEVDGQSERLRGPGELRPDRRGDVHRPSVVRQSVQHVDEQGDRAGRPRP